MKKNRMKTIQEKIKAIMEVPLGEHRYYCKYCHQVVWRNSNKKHVKSWCCTTEKNVRLRRIEK